MCWGHANRTWAWCFRAMQPLKSNWNSRTYQGSILRTSSQYNFHCGHSWSFVHVCSLFYHALISFKLQPVTRRVLTDPPQPRAMLTKLFDQTEVCILLYSNIERGIEVLWVLRFCKFFKTISPCLERYLSV